MYKTLEPICQFIFPNKIGRLDFFLRILFWLMALAFITVEAAAVGDNLLGIEPDWISLIGGSLMIIGSAFSCIARLRDAGKSTGKSVWYLIWIYLFPVIGFIVLLCISSANDHANQTIQVSQN
ncbi:DUF805 domain-containing protein [Legionella israelensis]|uniref:DUF805 domain-containing protein n=1 Tax=Legionella israelensis TaxID=454 RepID=A0A0W0V1L0_9GAMM|nr:DUF805 domain-containing protein [Legionella israelensis]KTD13983.1 hypothetical protein Lisr_2759 [Legionella israelensis]QBS09642.1 DUF805 domain-containing protein [Legionella israelensis]SCY25482.1 Uncharacterized membrane protein YhaH, DUF805 family [Legionella israelensis DSM 19235]STX60573.1 Protein of uncharacterised function (DUF805) [Legionella israelensis]